MDLQEYNHSVRQLSDALYRFACKCTGHQEEARDLVQSGFEALWMKRADVPAEKAKAFLFQVVYNQSVSKFRSAGREVLAEVDENHLVSHSNHGLRRALDDALQTLDPQSRALVLLKDYEGYSYSEIGQLTKLSESQVKVYLFRARKKLQAYIVRPENVL
jgi:RNA polymerase sigma-70 factor (ECF subfamily)